MIFRFLAHSSIRFCILLGLAIPLLSACETNDDRALADAQHCINTADSSNVDQCVAKVSGMSSQQAYLIKCSAHFIKQNITASKLASGFANIKNPSNSGTPPTTTALAYLVFNDTLTGHTIADAVSDCNLSGATSLYRLTLLANIATTAVEVTGILNTATQNATPDVATLKSNIQNLANTQPATLGNMAISVRDNFCNNGSSYASSDICNKMNAAFATGNGDPTAIGQQIGALLNQ